MPVSLSPAVSKIISFCDVRFVISGRRNISIPHSHGLLPATSFATLSIVCFSSALSDRTCKIISERVPKLSPAIHLASISASSLSSTNRKGLYFADVSGRLTSRTWISYPASRSSARVSANIFPPTSATANDELHCKIFAIISLSAYESSAMMNILLFR